MATGVRRAPKRLPAARRQRGASLLATLAAILLLLAAAVAVALYVYLQQAVSRPLQTGDAIFTIERGQSLRSFAEQLHGAGIVEEPYSLLALAHWNGLATRIKAGQYRLDEGISLRGVLDKLVSGDVVVYQVRFIEGWTFREMLAELSRHGELENLTVGLDDAEIMERLGTPDLHPEGRFFPDTYQYIAGDSDLDILRRAFHAMTVILDEEWQGRSEDLPLDDPYQALILASIVEKETGLGAERGQIAGVFVNRLNRNMRLQTDPTVIYGIGEGFDGNITRRDLRTDTPYNTYTRRGLPPTPIAMPGRDAIRAAVRPESTRSLYFVSRGDGSHHFSEDLEAHNAAVRKYQLAPARSDG